MIQTNSYEVANGSYLPTLQQEKEKNIMVCITSMSFICPVGYQGNNFTDRKETTNWRISQDGDGDGLTYLNIEAVDLATLFYTLQWA